MLDDEPHKVLLYGEEEVLAGLYHQGHHQLQDLGHVADHHEVVFALSGERERRHEQHHLFIARLDYVARNVLLVSIFYYYRFGRCLKYHAQVGIAPLTLCSDQALFQVERLKKIRGTFTSYVTFVLKLCTPLKHN